MFRRRPKTWGKKLTFMLYLGRREEHSDPESSLSSRCMVWKRRTEPS
jgi:hypothetical protein